MKEVEFFKKITIPELVGFYEVGSFGSIKKLSRESLAADRICPNTKEIILKPNKTNKGYHRIRLGVYRGKRRWYYAHRLVALAFLDKVDGKDHVNHKDGNKDNNSYTNLEWCTPQENNEHGFRTGLLKKGKFYKPKPYVKKGKPEFVKPVIDLNTGIFWTPKEVAFLLNTKRKYIHRLLSEERKPNTTQYRYA